MSTEQSSSSGKNRGPLVGIKVLDLTIAMAGPMCTQRMGEMGADITKIEAPGGGDFSRHAPMAGVTKFGDATCYVTLNRNKKSLVLNLKSDDGRAVLYEMVRQADVWFRISARGLQESSALILPRSMRSIHGSFTGRSVVMAIPDR